MRTKQRNRLFFFLVLILFLIGLAAAVGIGLLRKLMPKEEPDPHAGQVYLYDGFDWIWMTPLEGVPVNELTAGFFSSAGGDVAYIGEDYKTMRGVDVSEHQLGIDWPLVASSGVDYAYVRMGWRGYTEGGLFEDARWETNLRGAYDSGLRCGVYFFSQAVNVAEAIEEANFVLERIADYPVDLPVIYDWEEIEDSGARTAELALETRTDCAVAFCETIRRAGYEPGVYFNRRLGYYGYDLRRLTDYVFWFSLPESPFPNFYYACDMWQYSFTENVPGIEGPTDMNLMFVKKENGQPNQG